MTILVKTKKEVENMDICDEYHAFISIHDPPSEFHAFIKINSLTKGLLYLNFDDNNSQEEWTDQGWEATYQRKAVLFTEDMANKIFDFLSKTGSVEILVVNCHMAISRSTAVAKFISKVLGERDFSRFEKWPKNPLPLIGQVMSKVWFDRTGEIL